MCEVDFLDSCQVCSTAWLWIWNPSACLPRTGCEVPVVGVRFLGFWRDASIVETLHRKPWSLPSLLSHLLSTLYLKVAPDTPPFRELMTFLLLIQAYWWMHLKTASSHEVVFWYLRLPLDSASTYLSIYPVTSELTLPVYPQNTHKYPPLPRWH